MGDRFDSGDPGKRFSVTAGKQDVIDVGFRVEPAEHRGGRLRPVGERLFRLVEGCSVAVGELLEALQPIPGPLGRETPGAHL